MILCLYRPPQTKKNWWNNISDLILEILEIGSIIFMGDLNADLLKKDLNQTKELLNLIKIAGTVNRSTEATRITTVSSTCLDLIAIDKNLNCIEYYVEKNAASDHFPVTALIDVNFIELKLEPIRKKSYRKMDYLKLNEKIKKIVLPEKLTVNEMLGQWQLGINKILDELAPVQKFPMIKKKRRIIDDEIFELMRKRDKKAKKLKQKNNSEKIKDELKTIKKQIKSLIKEISKKRN